MRVALVTLWLMLGSLAGLGPAGAQALPPGVTAADQAAIQQVIQGQLNAFQRDDAAGAYAYAAPNIRRLFPTADVFMGMVRNAYPPVYRPKQAEFSELALREGELVQEVELVGPDGKPVLALYSMEKSPDGRWLIASCILIFFFLFYG